MPIGRTLLPIAAGGGGTGSTPDNFGLYTWGSDGIVEFLEMAVSKNLPDNLYYFDDETDIYKFDIGTQHLVAIRNFSGSGGELWVLGRLSNGNIGNSTSQYEWARLGSDSDWTDVSASADSTYAIRAGRLYVLGLNTSGQLGNGSTSNVTTLTQIGSDTNWEAVDAGETWALAIKGGQLFSCGSNNLYRTGRNTNSGNTTTWTAIETTQIWVKISAGRQHGGAITIGGEVWTWGSNLNGRTARNTTAGETQVPTQTHDGDTHWIKISCGSSHTLVIKNDNTLWGAGSGAQIGKGASTNTIVFTQEVLGDTDWYDINSGGADVGSAIKSDGTLWTAGRNNVAGGFESGHRGLSDPVTTFTQLTSLNKYNKISSNVSAFGRQYAVYRSNDPTDLFVLGDVTPASVNWTNIEHNLNTNSYTYTTQQITGIDSSITLKITYTNSFNTLYYKIDSSSPSYSGSPATNGFTAIGTNRVIVISDDEYLSFGMIGIAGDTSVVTVKNQSDGNATLDTFNAVVIGGPPI
jgi:alpha-tubulin suppressor-like RCC1 family protein